MGYTLLRITRLDEGFLLEEGEDGKKYSISTGADMIEKVQEIFGLNCEKAQGRMTGHATDPVQEERAKHLLAEREAIYDAANDVSNLASCDTPFIFQECEPIDWSDLPTFRSGKTMYHIAHGKVHITRQGYGTTQVWALLDDLKRLRVLDPVDMKKALVNLHPGRRPLITGFLKDVFFSQIGVRTEPKAIEDTGEQEQAENNEKSARIERLRVIAREKQDKWRAEKENAARADQ